MLNSLIEYHDGSVLLEAYCSYQDSNKKKPAIIVIHDWSGRNEFACQKADKMAELGYVGFALDMYGKGKIGQTKEQKLNLMKPFMQDRRVLLQRILSAINALKQIEVVDQTKIAAVGFCFGGLCVLDLARSGEKIRGVVSIHGLLQPPEIANQVTINAKVLALHGYDDPMVKPDDVVAFGNEMTNAHADWQLHIFGNTMHAFTNPEANDSSFGTVYNKKSDARTWVLVENFLSEIFS